MYGYGQDSFPSRHLSHFLAFLFFLFNTQLHTLLSVIESLLERNSHGKTPPEKAVNPNWTIEQFFIRGPSSIENIETRKFLLFINRYSSVCLISDFMFLNNPWSCKHCWLRCNHFGSEESMYLYSKNILDNNTPNYHNTNEKSGLKSSRLRFNPFGNKLKKIFRPY